VISLDEGLALIAQTVDALPPEPCPVTRCAARILREPAIAHITQPPADVSAMDGYAVRASDLDPAGISLSLQGESAAGHPFRGALQPGCAVRISTGAALPSGADQIVIQENCEREADQIHTRQAPAPGAHIRRAGQDFSAGQTLIDAGTRLSPEAVSLAAAAGLATLSVAPQLRVGILATGDELVEPGETPGPGQIINSISHGLAALVARWGGEPVYLGIARDDPADIATRLDRAAELDLLVTIGGASVGDHDHLRSVFTRRQGQLVFEKLAVKPGKPTWFGLLGAVPVIGLPGNPVSALVMARLVLRPALDRLLGHAHATVFQTATLNGTIAANGPRETFHRAVWSAGIIRTLPRQDSSLLTALTGANALLRQKADAPAASDGDTVEFLLMD
jgi:molybdopterin molybdotransferase